MRDIFTLSGKLTRQEYVIAVFIDLLMPVVVLCLALVAVLVLNFPEVLSAQQIEPSRYTAFGGYSLLIFGICALIVVVGGNILAIKRLRDLGKNGTLSMLLYIPMVGIVFFGYLLLAKSKSPEVVRVADDVATDNMGKLIPVGFRIVLAVLAVSFLWLVFVLLYNNAGAGNLFQIGPYFVQGITTNSVIVFNIAVIIGIFIAVVKGNKWGYHLNLWWGVFVIILGAVNGILLLLDPTVLDTFYQKSVMLESFNGMTRESMFSEILYQYAFSVLSTLALICYFYKNQDYFKNT